MAQNSTRKALVVGATGLIGGLLLRQLLEDRTWAQVITMGRRGPGVENSKLQALTVDFDELGEKPEMAAHFPVDDVFCCLGTTIKKAGSKEAFRKVDHDYVLATARAGLAAGATRMVVISSVGASAKAMSFYLRVKGELEASLEGLGYPALHLFQPSVLLGDREESRPFEAVGIAAARRGNFLLGGALAKYKGVEAVDVASAMIAAAKRGGDGVHRHRYEDIMALLGREV